MKVILTSSESSRALTIGCEYEVLGIEADHYRILTDETAEHYPSDPLLFPPSDFEIADAHEPGFWKSSIGEDGERYCYPPEWDHVGFFEDYHDGVPAARDQFWRDLQRYYPSTWARHGT